MNSSMVLEFDTLAFNHGGVVQDFIQPPPAGQGGGDPTMSRFAFSGVKYKSTTAIKLMLSGYLAVLS